MSAAPSIRVIIVNFNAEETIVSCVSSVMASDEPSRITVFDNASTDGSMQRLSTSFSGHSNMDLVQNDENIGFARAINAVAKSATEKYLLFLNPDCELFPGALSSLKQALAGDPDAALAGPLVVDRLGAVQKGTLRRFPDPWTSLLTFTGLWRLEPVLSSFRGVNRHQGDLPQDTVQAEAVSGACMLMRQDRFIQVGYMDESYGLHCEDLDLMYRLCQMGYHCLLVPSARVFHRQGVSSSSRPYWVHRQKHLGMQRFFRKFQSDRYPWPVRWLVIGGIWLRYALTLPLVFIRN